MNLNVGGTAHVALWDAINALVDASGGRNGVSTARMTAVANVESALRAVLADSEGTRAVECLRRARNAEATLADALFVLGMVDKNNRIDAGETGKAWSGRFVADEVRRVLAGESGDDQAWDRNAERITREALGDDVTRPINPHATSIDDL